MKARPFVIAAGLFVTASALGGTQEPRIEGTVAYRERIALPPTATIEVTLEDVSRADAPASLISTAQFDTRGRQVPIPFSLSFDPARIDDRHRYAVRAKITDGDRVLFTTSQQTPVLTQGHGLRVTLMLTRVSAESAAPTAPPASGAGAGQGPTLQQNFLTDLPATFTGTMPCADCPGVKYQLNLFPDDSFFLRMTYLERPGAAPVDDIGTWVLSSDRRILVLKGARDTAELFGVKDSRTLRKLDLEGKEIVSKAPYDLKRAPALVSLDIRMPMRGSYRYMADAGSFVECSTGQTWPVATEGANRDLESAYTKARKQPGDPVVFTIDGHLAARPGMEGAGSRTTLVVDKVGQAFPRETCPARFTAAPLEKTTWILTRLGDRTIPPAANPRQQPSLTFETDTGHFSGSGGCNRLIGGFQASGMSLSMTAAGTMMACPSAMDTEAAFGTALKGTRAYRIIGRTLEFYDATGKTIARFEAK